VGEVAKKYRVLTDREALEEVEFPDEIAGTLGDYATTNQYLFGTLKERLKQKYMLIRKLQNQIAAVETNVRNEAYKDLEQARATDQQKTEQLKSNLEKMHQSAQMSQTHVDQQEELIKQLQSKLNSTEIQVMDIMVF
jgi:chromosome segregation ATPase